MTWFGEAVAGFKVLGQLSKWYRSWRNPPVAKRLVWLFESHGVHRNQIPRFFGHGLTLKDVQDDDSILAKLDEPVLQAVCEQFNVRREWLDGADPQIHPCHDFYKHPGAFADFIGSLMANNPNGDLHGVLIAPKERDWLANALLVLQETVGSVGDKPIYRYHLCNNWAFTYWKARVYLTACIAIAWKHKVYVHGISMPKKEIERMAEGKMMLGWQGEGIWELGNKTWDAEDMALQPATFLKDIDPERVNFGIKAGLELWLDLEEKGLMNTGIQANARQLFEQELAKY